MHQRPTRPEILAPAGGPDCLPAAVAGGADAVYLGLRHFNARGRAENFRSAELADHVAYLHHHGLKCYVVLNTLVHDDELAKALDLAAAAHAAAVDAVIVQDLGLWRLLGQELPGLERHSSTQMTVHEPAQVEALAALGATRLVTARELSRDDLAACMAAARACGVEIEHFVHGALCYAFSGQCLISNFAGCRSANRGTCAQNCRFEYRPPADADADTLLSMKDLSLLAEVPELCDMGVASFKIEGRLKGPEYVYLVSRIYREAVDAWQRGEAFDVAAGHARLREVFARGFTDAAWRGGYGAAAREHRYASDQQPDGRLLSLDRRSGRALLDVAERPQPGQGYRLVVDDYRDGFLITGIDERRRDGAWPCRVRIGRHGPRIPANTPIHRNTDHRHRAAAETAMAQVPLAAVRARRVVDLRISAEPGQPLALAWTLSGGASGQLHSDLPVQAASAAPLSVDGLRSKLGAFADAPYQLGDLVLDVSEPCFVPAAALKRLRRALVAELAGQAAVEPLSPTWQPPVKQRPRLRQTALWVAVADLASAQAALAAG
ncbi:MAG: peptidase U32 family protein, partial [Planctomycetota bacterium]